MKPASDVLKTFLATTREFVYADVFTFYLVGGTDETYRLRYTNAQQNLSVYPLDGDVIKRTFSATAMLISGLRAKQSIGVEVDEQTLTLTPAEGTLIQGVPALEAIISGALDGAFVRRDRFYYAAWGQEPVGGAPMFYGLVSTFDEVGRTDAKLKVKSGLVLLNQPMPRQLFQPTCLNRVYDTACGLDQNAFAVHGVVGAGATTTFIPWTGSTAGLSLGRIFMEDLGLVGVWRAIKTADTSGITLAYPLPAVPAAGENFTAYPGGDRTYVGCCTKFANTARWRATRFVPQAEKAF